MRIEFKKQKVKKSEFFKFCEDNGANFFETDDEVGVWIIPKKYGDSLLGIKLRKDGRIFLILLNEDCMNIRPLGSGISIYIEEQNWIIQTLTLFKKYKPVRRDRK